MVDDLIPAEIRDFIVNYIDSIAQLEALLLLRGNPGERWTSDVIASRLYIDPAAAEEVLKPLCARGLLACEDDIYSYVGQHSQSDSLVGKLAVLYARHLIPVTNLIHSKPSRIHEFASAFKLRKDT